MRTGEYASPPERPAHLDAAGVVRRDEIEPLAEKLRGLLDHQPGGHHPHDREVRSGGY
jgi:hypothetical protein